MKPHVNYTIVDTVLVPSLCVAAAGDVANIMSVCDNGQETPYAGPVTSGSRRFSISLEIITEEILIWSA